MRNATYCALILLSMLVVACGNGAVNENTSAGDMYDKATNVVEETTNVISSTASKVEDALGDTSGLYYFGDTIQNIDSPAVVMEAVWSEYMTDDKMEPSLSEMVELYNQHVPMFPVIGYFKVNQEALMCRYKMSENTYYDIVYGTQDVYSDEEHRLDPRTQLVQYGGCIINATPFSKYFRGKAQAYSLMLDRSDQSIPEDIIYCYDETEALPEQMLIAVYINTIDHMVQGIADNTYKGTIGRYGVKSFVDNANLFEVESIDSTIGEQGPTDDINMPTFVVDREFKLSSSSQAAYLYGYASEIYCICASKSVNEYEALLDFCDNLEQYYLITPSIDAPDELPQFVGRFRDDKGLFDAVFTIEDVQGVYLLGRTSTMVEIPETEECHVFVATRENYDCIYTFGDIYQDVPFKTRLLKHDVNKVGENYYTLVEVTDKEDEFNYFIDANHEILLFNKDNNEGILEEKTSFISNAQLLEKYDSYADFPNRWQYYLED